MFYFSESSQEKLDTTHRLIQELMTNVLKYIDITILEGHRTQERQMELFLTHRSELNGTNKLSKHQQFPSLAVDVIPYKKGHNVFDGSEKSTLMFYELARRVFIEARKLGLNITWGGHWESLIDMPHWQIKLS